MTDLIYRGIFILLIIRLLFTMYQRRFGDEGTGKRVLSLYQSVYIGVIYIAMSAIMARGYSEKFIFIALGVGIIAGWLFRKRLFAYNTRCLQCGEKLGLNQILFIDSNKCSNCTG